MRDDGSGQLLMKTAQESLRYGDKQSKSTMTVYKVCLGWEENLRKFWEEQSRLLEGKASNLCTFFRMNGQWGQITRFSQFSRGTSRDACRVNSQGLHSFSGEVPRSLAAKISQFPEGTTNWLLGSLEAKTVQLLEGNSNKNYAISRGNCQQRLHNSQREMAVFHQGLLERKNALRPGGWPVDHLCPISNLS